MKFASLKTSTALVNDIIFRPSRTIANSQLQINLQISFNLYLLSESSSLTKMKVVLNILVILVALHSCSAFYSMVLSEAMKLCPKQNEEIINLATECKESIVDVIQITAHETDAKLYQGYQM